jgi:small subunit ribosomal protein S15
MNVTTERKAEIVKDFETSEGDNGSPQVQIALLTERINSLTQHMRSNSKDYSSRRGLLRMVSRRRSLLDYIREREPDIYLDLISRLGIRK